MSGKQYVRLGKTKLVRVPVGVESWVKKMARELDTKENPQETMDMLYALLEKTR